MKQAYDIATYADLEKFYGGSRGMQERFGLSQPGVACWKMRGGVPPGYHLRIYLEMRMAGKSLNPELFELEAPLADFMNRCCGDERASA